MLKNANHQRKIDDCSDDIDKIRKWINHNLTDSKVRYLVAYAVVRVSGTIEYVFKQMIYDYLSAGASKDAKKYLEHMIIESSRNPKTSIMEQLLRDCDVNKADVFTASLKSLENEEKSRLNSLVSLRNDVAHGRSINSSINNVSDALQAGIRILDKLEQALSGDLQQKESPAV